ncbi:hypothetical protein B0H14DRAFT_3657396 [Mycena olivaceomarginata]|nr:hypothetical protein B0H14DRAFT_3657396 [Mycena olivaceomarginata]
MTSILSAGTFFGALVTGDVADVLGCHSTIIIGCVLFTIDVGVGFISAIIILHMSEIAPKKARGALVSGYQFAHYHRYSARELCRPGHSKQLDTAMAGTGSWEALGPVLHSFDWESRAVV